MQFNLGQAIGDFFNSVSGEIARHNALPPDKKNRARASGGTGLFAFCLYAVSAAPAAVFSSWLYFAIWAVLAAFGSLWLYVGLKVAAAPRDLMAAFWSAGGMLLFLGLMVSGTYLPAEWQGANFLLKGIYTAAAAGFAMRLWISGRGVPNTKLDDVRAQQAHGRARDATAAEAAARLGAQTAPRAPRQFQD